MNKPLLPDGLYELLTTESIEALEDRARFRFADVGDDGPARLAEAIGRQLALVLEDFESKGGDKATKQLELVNSLLGYLRTRLADEASNSDLASVVDLFAHPLKVLTSVGRSGNLASIPPSTGVASPWLFTAGKGVPSLLGEIRAELSTCDQVDILVSFITVSGVRKLRDVFQSITAVNATGRAPIRIRVLTTTYIGATEARAIDELATLPGCEVKVSLDGRRTRLHAKAWIFRRESGFGTAYVGSANLSGAALTGGLEWTVKFTQRAQEPMYTRAIAHFDTLWEDSEFEAYDPKSELHRAALVNALRRESGRDGVAEEGARFFDLHPKTYQQEMLEQLVSERTHGRNRNLVVAATGTGKTMVAAFDYRSICAKVGGRPRLLFVAHREEILRQAIRTYREVLRDPTFGDLLFGGSEPRSMDHLFATIDSVSSRSLIEMHGPTNWYVVVVDECHRIAADRFSRFAGAVKPSILLGLTATPERTDGLPISTFFDSRPDGGPAVELRLWNALDQQLLAPFEYYACDDETDFSDVPWDQIGERVAIENLVTSNHVRARLVVNEWERLANDPRKSKALVFCISVAHARFTADFLSRAGYPAVCVVGEDERDHRQSAPRRLANGEICAIVTVDLYNEGVDLPFVDTLLLLRPTQSPVIFQQQIGRGLRQSTGKESCLVLDFVGQHRADFRFDRLLGSVTGLSRRQLESAVEEGFGSLPPGCHIQLQPKTREQVLRSLRALSSNTWRRLRNELQSYVALTGHTSVRFGAFVREQKLEVEEFYRSSGESGWTRLKRAAGLLVAEPGPEEEYFGKRLSSVLHIDDPIQIDLMLRIGHSENLYVPTSSEERRRVQMLAYQIDGRSQQVGDAHSFLNRLEAHAPIREEIAELAAMLSNRSTVTPTRIAGLEDTPLLLHTHYGIREILTAVGWLSETRRSPFQAGVLPLLDRKIELLFVTLDKSAGFHDRISYHDYAISPELFHWQSQNSAGPGTQVGRRYIESETNGWTFFLFVRTTKSAPYLSCGPVQLDSAHGDRPMNIKWRLGCRLPARYFQEFSVLRAA